MKELLESKELLHLPEENRDPEKYKFFVSDVADKFRNFAETIFSNFNEELAAGPATEQVNIEEY